MTDTGTGTMTITRLWEDGAGESHFEDVEIPLASAGPIGRVSASFRATELLFRETAGDYQWSWHNAPRRQYIVMLEGGVEITASDGESRVFEAGDVLLVEDLEGKGHVSRALRGQRRRTLFIAAD